jgi:outer membrane protein OmpA-like peptidoglycan-associated protein
MPVNRTILSSSTLTTSGIALCIALLATGLPSSSLAACAHYQTQVLKAVQAKDLDKLETLLPTLGDCPPNYLEWVKRSMAQIAARQADNLAPQGGLGEAKALLKRAPTIVWSTQVVRGDIAARQKQWQDASQFYNQALDLIADPQSTPNPPPEAVIKKIYNLASQAQILAGNLDATVSRSGQASGVMRSSVRGFKPRKRLIPVLFGFGRYKLSEKGKYAAQQLAAYLKQRYYPHSVIVHRII